MFKFTVIESPFGSKNPVVLARNIRYLHAAIQDCLKRGEVPYASHGFFPGALDDNIPDQRAQGIQAGFETATALLRSGDGIRAFYLDRGMSRGMVEGLERHRKVDALSGSDIRVLGPEWKPEADPTCLPDVHAGPVSYEKGPARGVEGAEVTRFFCEACKKYVLPSGFSTVTNPPQE